MNIDSLESSWSRYVHRDEDGKNSGEKRFSAPEIWKNIRKGGLKWDVGN